MPSVPDTNHIDHFESDHLPITSNGGNLDLKHPPESNHVYSLELDCTPDSNHTDHKDSDHTLELASLLPNLYSSDLETEEEGEEEGKQDDRRINKEDDGLKKQKQEEGLELNTELRVLITREIRKPGRCKNIYGFVFFLGFEHCFTLGS